MVAQLRAGDQCDLVEEWVAEVIPKLHQPSLSDSLLVRVLRVAWEASEVGSEVDIAEIVVDFVVDVEVAMAVGEE